MSVRVRSSSVGAYPRPKPILVSRAESTAPIAAEVRCGCQFYQSDSLLPERINPVGQSRPESSVDYYVETISRPISPISRPISPASRPISPGSRPISPLSINNPHYGSDAHFPRPGSSLSCYKRADIIRPEPIIISVSVPPMDSPPSSTFRPIPDRPPKYMGFSEEGKPRAPSPSIRDASPSRPSLIGRDRLSDRNINVSSQILRNRSRSTSIHGADNVGKIVKTVSFEFGGPDGPDQYRSPYAEHDLSKRNTPVVNNTGAIAALGSSTAAALGNNKGSAHSFVKFERKDRSSQDRYNEDRYTVYLRIILMMTIFLKLGL